MEVSCLCLRRGATFWSIKIRRNCCSGSWGHSHHSGVPLKLARICFSMLLINTKMFILFIKIAIERFSYLIEHDVCYLVLCEKNYSKRLAYSYLEDIAQEFHVQYGKRVNTVTRPYTFIEFDTYIQKAKKIFTDSRARRNLSAINNQLQDVQRIMVQNIDDVLQRGTVLSGWFYCQ